MKKLLIRLTGLMVTAAIVLSTSGIALATEVGEQDDNTGIKAEEPAEFPDEEEPEKAPAEDPAGDPKEEPAKDEAPSNDSKDEQPAEGAKEEPAKEDKAAPGEDTKSKEESKENSTAYHEESVKLSKDNKELAEDYYNHVFGIAKPTKRSSYNYASAFSGRDLELYNYLNEQVAKVASGEISTTQFETSINFTAEELGLTNFNFSDAVNAANDILDSSIPEILRTLIQANPYNFYWFSGRYGWGYHYSSNGITLSATVTISFYVSENYKAGNDDFTVDNSYGDKVNAAYTNAMEIVDQYAPLDDYNKLKAYKNKICELTDYNHPAADDDDTPYGNPWQMIWVFDGDPDTKVVCEGYSKAFLFLCQKSTFRSSDVYAITVTGLMDGGAHMWNIVHMDDGQDYLVDVTNCDSGFSLFLRGKDATQTVDGGYRIKASNSTYITYVYDDEYVDRNIPTTDYSVNSNPGPITEPVFVSSHSMILAGRIGLKFLVDFPENYDTSSCYMVFTSSDGRTIRVDYDKSETGEGFENKRAFTFYMNALELADTVTATLHYGDGKTTTDVYSVISYISDTKSSSYGSDFFLMNLLYKLQAYGYYLQKSGWNDGRTHTQIPIPVSTLIETNIPKTVIVDGCLEETISSVSSYSMTLTQTSTLIADVKLALSLNSQTDLKIAVKPASGVAITSDASEYSIVSIGNEDYYVFTAVEIGPKKLGESKNITIKTDKGNATISVPPMYYVKQVLNSNSFETNQKNAMIAYYNYFDAANRYKN